MSVEAIKDEISVILHTFEADLIELCERIDCTEVDTVFVEYAGFGDAIHSRLMIQQYRLEHPEQTVAWFVNKNVANIYRNEELVFGHHVINRYRYPHNALSREVIKCLGALVDKAFVHSKLRIYDLSKKVIQYHIERRRIQQWKSFEFPYYDSMNMKRNYDIKHVVKHNGKMSDFDFFSSLGARPWILFEHSSMSFRTSSNPKAYAEFVQTMIKNDVPVVLVGAKDDFFIDGCYNCLGANFYDVITLMRNCSCFVGRNSANQMMSVFTLKPINILELDTVDHNGLLSFKKCEYLPVNSIIRYYDTRKTVGYIEHALELAKK